MRDVARACFWAPTWRGYGRRRQEGAGYHHLVHDGVDVLAREAVEREIRHRRVHARLHLRHVRLGDVLEADGKGALALRRVVAGACEKKGERERGVRQCGLAAARRSCSAEEATQSKAWLLGQ